MQKLNLLLFVILFLPLLSFSQLFTVGPVLNWNFGNKQCKFGAGFELGIHALPVINENNKEMFLSLELGFDFEKSKSRFYTEFQLTKYIPAEIIPIIYSVSAGPVIEWGKETKTSLGFQSTANVWYLLGANFRYRWMKGKSYYIPGVFLKIPFTFMKISPG